MRKWRPYAGRRDESAWYDLQHAVPDEHGYYQPSPVYEAYQSTTTSGVTSPGYTLNHWVGLDQSGSTKQYIGTTTKILQLTGFTDLTDVSRTTGGAYTAATSGGMWQFATFGNIGLATNYADEVQAQTPGVGLPTPFFNLSGSPPKAKHIAVQSNAVLLFNYNDGVNTYNDGWWASDVGDYTTWTPASSNDAANGRLLGGGGAITAAVPYKDIVLVFTESQTWAMKYVGQPVVWDVQRISGTIGVVGAGMVVPAGDFVFLMTRGGPYVYDGTSFTFIGKGLTKYNGTSVFTPCKYNQGGNYYENSGHVVFYGSGDAQRAAISVYNMRSDCWGYYEPFRNNGGSGDFLGLNSNHYVPLIGSQAGREFFRSFIPYGTDGNRGQLYVDLSANPFMMTDNARRSGTNYGDLYRMKLSTNIYGNEGQMTQFTGAVPVYDRTMDDPWSTAYTGRGYYLTPYTFAFAGTASGTAGTQVQADALNKRFDFNLTARFAQFQFVSDGDCQVGDIMVKQKPAGTD